jgi:hypothetical protein
MRTPLKNLLVKSEAFIDEVIWFYLLSWFLSNSAFYSQTNNNIKKLIWDNILRLLVVVRGKVTA